MQAFEQFIIHWREFEWENTLSFSYSFDEKEWFKESIIFPSSISTNSEDIDIYCFNLTLALWVSYYKLFPTKNIIVKAWMLTDSQQKFWHTYYQQGLSEFFYVNKLDPRGLTNFVNDSDIIYKKDESVLPEKSLLLRWWGKDSIASFEMLSAEWREVTMFTFWRDFPIHKQTQEVTWVDRLVVWRQLDLPQLKKLTAEWYYNGHVSITAIISFVSVLLCKLYGFNEIVTSNEKSANFWNVERKWMQVNHQRSKSFEFEKLFDEYVHTHVNWSLTYYSKLRSMYEREIAQYFAQFSKYFPVFSSCNRNFHMNETRPNARWCGICPKCLFVYMVLRPFVSDEQADEIWSKEMYKDESLLEVAKEIRWVSWIKPFECVWTPEESQEMTKKFIKNREWDVQWRPLLQWFVEHV